MPYVNPQRVDRDQEEAVRELFHSLAILACPVGEGAMMWFMAHGRRSRPIAKAATQAELPRMRAEIDQLRSVQHDVEMLAPKQ